MTRKSAVRVSRWAPLRRLGGISYVDDGVGTPLVCLHGGLSTSHDTWRHAGPMLTEHHRVIAPDLPGHGHSRGNRATLTHADMAEAVEHLLAELEVAPPWNLVGFSLGAAVATTMLLRAPEAIASLTLIGNNLWPTPTTRVGARTLRPNVIRAANPRFAAKLDALHDGDWEPLAARLAELWSLGPTVAPSAFANVRRLLAVHGDRDPWIPIEHQLALLEACQGSRLLVVPGADHFTLSRASSSRMISDAIRQGATAP